MSEQSKKSFLRRFWWLGVLGLILILLALYLTRPDQEPGRGIANKASQNNNCQSNVSPKFTTSFTDLSQIQALGILGGMIGGSPGRSYITIKNGSKVPLYAPGDAVLETIVYAPRGGPGTEGEYGLYFKASCEVTFLFDHIEELTDEFRVLAPSQPQEKTSTELGAHPNKEVKAGTLFGYTTGTELARTFDFQLINTSKKADHIKPERWDWEPTVSADCPYDYYEGDLKTRHYNLLGEPMDTDLKKAQDCGQLSKDIAGTASGGWFQGDSTTTKGKWLSLGKYFDTAEFSIREDGRHIFQVRDYSPKITPDQIKIGDSVCYQSYDNKWAYIKLDTDKLSVAKGEGTCPASFPTTGVEDWSR